MTGRKKTKPFAARRASDFDRVKRDQGTLKVPRQWKIGTNTRYVYPQQCFYRSFTYACHEFRRNVPGVWLVHGESSFAGGPHAWVELPDGLVFDAVYQRWYRNYYDAEGAAGRAWYKFAPLAAASILFEKWNEAGRPACPCYRFDNWLWLPRGNSDQPMIIDLERAEELLRTRASREAAAREAVHVTPSSVLPTECNSGGE